MIMLYFDTYWLFKQLNQIILYYYNKQYHRIFYKVLVFYRTAFTNYRYENLKMHKLRPCSGGLAMDDGMR